MALSTYQVDQDFEARRRALAEGLNSGLFGALDQEQTFQIVVYRVLRGDRFEPVAAGREFAAYLGLLTHAFNDAFERPQSGDARILCVNVAEFSLLTGRRFMRHEQAIALAAAWIAQFEDGAVFFSNIDSPAPPAKSPLGYNSGSLFPHDFEAGVLGVSPTRAGLFWLAAMS
jgi:hypothetical protein